MITIYRLINSNHIPNYSQRKIYTELVQFNCFFWNQVISQYGKLDGGKHFILGYSAQWLPDHQEVLFRERLGSNKLQTYFQEETPRQTNL